MSEFRETRIERAADGRVVGSTERIVERDGAKETPPPLRDRHRGDRGASVHETKRKGGGFGRGALFGIMLAAIALIVFALSQGSFTEAGRQADQAADQAQEQVERGAESAGDAAQRADDEIEQATDR
jgi:hypothetical protein